MIPWKKPLENKKLVIMVILLGDVFVIMVIPPW
jgi:hypothetical protein